MKVTRHVLHDDGAAATLAALAGDSFFLSPGAMDLWRAARGSAVVWVARADGRAIAAVGGIEFGAGPATRFASLPDGWPGGVLVDRAHARERARLATELLGAIVRRGYAHRYAKIAVFDPEARAAEHPQFSAEPYQAMRGELSGPDWAPPDRQLRSEIRRAGREGLVALRFEWARHGRGFLELARAAARRRGERPRYAAAMFERVAALAERDPRVIWRHCERDGRPVASQIYFLDRGTLFAWYECFDRRFTPLKPHQFLRFAACRDAIALGARRLDLGATPEGAAGVLAYKKHWGVEPVTLIAQFHWAGLGRFVRGARRLAAGLPGWTRGR